MQLTTPLDMHLHLRDEEMLENIAKASAHTFSGAIIMPNLVPPVSTKEDVIAYKERILKAIGTEKFVPYMTLFFKPSYDKAFLESIRDEITAIKLYPAGITTNSEGGVSGFDVEELRPALEAMSDLGIPLCVHGETNGFVMDREAEFVSIYERLASAFPKLKIIMEHITTKESVAALDRHENLYATITIHHLLITLDDVAGGMLQPHLFCKPIAKRPEDKEALLKVALEAHPKVMFGSDSAPHPKHAKEACGCAAGVFTAPIALQLLVELFETQDASMKNLQAFISGNAQKIYNISPLEKTVILEKEAFKVPAEYNGVVPMYANEEIAYSIKEVQYGH
ncbi:MAG TPA: dihydroorotase [Epsilonproteobacteria bacterium]|nr:dihydroorotase [Campylobacterota bacterium]